MGGPDLEETLVPGRWATLRRVRTTLLRSPGALVGSLLVLASLLQSPGLTTVDTKLDLTENPGHFLTGALTAWNPEMTFGVLQNQASGYLFPFGPFYLLGEACGIPMWFWQRMWSGLVLLAAFEGMRRVALAWQPLGRWSAAFAGLVYALSPRVLTTVGVLSGETLPGAILPWTMLPLVLARRGRLGWSTAIVVSAATVSFMGGHNATEVLYLLPMPALYLLWAGPWRGRLRHLALWSALVAMVTAWWIVPLIVLGSYSPPFLDYIESAATTTGPVGWYEALRGATQWVAFLPPGITDWEAGALLNQGVIFQALTFLVAVAGLVGLLWSRPREVPFLVVVLLGALVALTWGHGSLAGTPLAGSVRAFLDGVGAPFRNIHKADPLVRFPIAIGCALLVPRLWECRGAWRGLSTSGPRGRQAVRLVAMAVVAGLLANGVVLLMGTTRSGHGWTRPSLSWQQMATALQGLPGDSRVLVTPAAPAVNQTWGRTVDEPIQTLAGVHWVSRSQIPLVPAGSLRLLDTVEEQLARGLPSPGLASLLRRLGISHVLVRGDLVVRDDVPNPARASAAVLGSEGLNTVAAFGDVGGGVPELALYAVTGSAPRVVAVPVADVVGWTGTADALADVSGPAPLLAGAPLVPSDQATGATHVVTDAPLRRERDFGRVHDAYSGLMFAAESWASSRPHHDILPADAAPSALAGAGYAAIQASTSNSFAGVLGPVRADQSPMAVVDGNYFTSWASAPYTDPVGQWWEAEFTSSRSLDDLTVLLDQSTAPVTSVQLDTDTGSVIRAVSDDGTVQFSGVGTTTRVRLTITGVRGGAGQVRIAHVELGDTDPVAVALAQPIDGHTVVQLATDVGARTCVQAPAGPACDSAAARGPVEGAGLTRTLTVTAPGRFDISGDALARSAPATAELFDPVGLAIAVSASSTLDADPLVAGWAAVDGDPHSAWVSAAGDPSPSLSLSWSESRPVTRIVVGSSSAGGVRNAVVQSVDIDDVPAPAIVLGNVIDLITPTPGQELTIHFATSADSMAVSEVDVAGLQDLVYRAPGEAATGAACGLGPTIDVGGTMVPTAVVGTLADVRVGAPLRLTPCGEPVDLPVGSITIRAIPSDAFMVSSLTLAPTTSSPERPAQVGTSVTTWGSEDRTIGLDPGPPAVLSVRENANAGWRAELDGELLTPITVDGWAQGWVVPAGTTRVVHLTYAPAPWYRLALLVGLSLAMGLLVVAAVLVVRHRRRVGVGIALMNGQNAVVLDAETPTATPRWVRIVGVTGGLVLLASAGGPVVAVATLLGALAARRRAAAAVLMVLGCTVGAVGWKAVLGTPVSITGPDVLAAVIVGLVCGLILGREDSLVGRAKGLA